MSRGATATRVPPGPTGHWLTGNLASVRRDRLGFYTQCVREYGPVVHLRFGRRHVFLLSDPATIENVLVHSSRKFRKHFALRLNPLVLGQGLLTSDGDFWLRQRRLMQPAFLREQVARYGSIMVEHAVALRERWQPGQRRDICADMMALTLQITARTLFDADASSRAGAVAADLEAFQQSFQARFGLLMFLPAWLPFPVNLRAWRSVRRLDRVVYEFIEERRRSPREHQDLLSLLLAARDIDDGAGMTDQQLRDEAVTLFLAGHETTALTLSWAWYLLATHPEVEAKLIEEVHQLGNRLPTAADLPSLPYTHRVVQETMRLYPPAYVIGREALEDFEVNGYPVPRGTTLIMSQWVMHRDERYWEEPAAFRPDRWENDLMQRLPRIVYFPFGAGPRRCIGDQFALMETVLVLATLAQRWRFTVDPAHKVEPKPIFTLRPRDGIQAELTPR